MFFCFLSSRRRHTICALVTGVQTCALPIYPAADQASIPPFNTKVVRVVFASKRSRADAVRIPERHMKITSVEGRSEEHTSELQSLMRISYAVFCLKKKKR